VLRSCFDDVLLKVKALVVGCPCTDPTGCPGCVQNHRCSDYNVVLDKDAAKIIITRLIARRETKRTSPTRKMLSGPCTGTLVCSLSAMLQMLFFPGARHRAEEAEVDEKVTPRKEARQRAMKVARAMDGARARDLSLQRDWAESFPNYHPEMSLHRSEDD
jgi:hypothetical protein